MRLEDVTYISEYQQSHVFLTNGKRIFYIYRTDLKLQFYCNYFLYITYSSNYFFFTSIKLLSTKQEYKRIKHILVYCVYTSFIANSSDKVISAAYYSRDTRLCFFPVTGLTNKYDKATGFSFLDTDISFFPYSFLGSSFSLDT